MHSCCLVFLVVCVCVCEIERKREREREKDWLPIALYWKEVESSHDWETLEFAPILTAESMLYCLWINLLKFCLRNRC
jgi:hypothetical protein